MNPEDKQLTYNQAVAQLEAIVARMQSDDCDIDKLSAYTRRALELLRLCKEKLTTTDEEIKKCLEELQ
ncbi:MAG TPA: exodeoxyribonuclease VII small subunit [Porphyromonadaceae bacterium]|nr:exodeoxyribonuclease VII small subunit [Porphyromonadaceae bacterium]